MKTLLVVGDDFFGRVLLERLGPQPGLITAFDVSPTLARAFRALRRGSLKPGWLWDMALAGLRRRPPGVRADLSVRGNAGLLAVIREEAVERVVLFRAGLIIDRTMLAEGIPVFNIHCARLPGLPGLGAIHRALADGAYRQAATLYRVTERIDDGEIVDTEPYHLDPASAYGANEVAAYEAGMRLAQRFLSEA